MEMVPFDGIVNTVLMYGFDVVPGTGAVGSVMLVMGVRMPEREKGEMDVAIDVGVDGRAWAVEAVLGPGPWSPVNEADGDGKVGDEGVGGRAWVGGSPLLMELRSGR